MKRQKDVPSLQELLEERRRIQERQPDEQFQSWEKKFRRKRRRGPTGVEIASYFIEQREPQAELQIRELLGKMAEQNDPEIDKLIAARNLDSQTRDAIDEMHRALFPIERVPSTDRQEQAADAANKEPTRNTSSPTVELTNREEKILDVSRQGPKGLAYCRELDNAGVKPRRTGSWQGCPGTYPAAYQAGEPWRHRIQDEKYRVNRKAKPVATRQPLADE